MTIEDEIRDEKLQHNINIETPKTFALQSSKIDKYEHFASDAMLPINQTQIIEQAKFINSPLAKALENLKSLNLSNEVCEIKQTECIFPNSS